MRHPDVILIYGDGTSDYQAFGGHYNGGDWKCSAVIPLSPQDIDGFLSEMRGMGRTVLDVRRNGDVLVPIMALMPGFPLAQASAFAAHISGIILREVRTDASEGGVEHE